MSISTIAGLRNSKVFAALNMETANLGTELSNVAPMINGISRELENAYSGLAQPRDGDAAIAKLMFISVLKNAIEKASRAKLFNIETAINDLLVHLDSARKVAGPRASGPTVDLEMTKLKQSLLGQGGLMETLSQLMKNGFGDGPKIGSPGPGR